MSTVTTKNYKWIASPLTFAQAIGAESINGVPVPPATNYARILSEPLPPGVYRKWEDGHIGNYSTAAIKNGMEELTSRAREIVPNMTDCDDYYLQCEDGNVRLCSHIVQVN